MYYVSTAVKTFGVRLTGAGLLLPLDRSETLAASTSVTVKREPCCGVNCELLPEAIFAASRLMFSVTAWSFVGITAHVRGVSGITDGSRRLPEVHDAQRGSRPAGQSCLPAYHAAHDTV